MKRSSDLLILLFIFVFWVLACAGSVLAQNHAGHRTSAAATEKTKASTPAEKQPATGPPEEVPQVEISTEQQKLIGVKTAKAAVRPLKKVIRTVGRIEADESRQATINAKIEGWIEKLYVNTTGVYVKKGDKLAEIYSPELVATQQEYLTALKWTKEAAADESVGDRAKSSEVSRMLARDARATLDAARSRLLLWDISEGQIEQIAQTGKPLRSLTLYAPVSGYVTQKMVVSGMRVMPGEKMLDISDLSVLWVIADIYEYELSLIKVGNRASITVASVPGTEFTSRIDYIYPDLAPQTRTAKVRLKLSNVRGQLKPQMFANVEIKIDLGRRLTIPESAVIDTGIATVAYVDRGGGAFEPREVKTGLRADGYVEVLRGLKNGESVVAAANFLVDSEAQLKGIKPLPSR